jgi:hypothetical protein
MKRVFISTIFMILVSSFSFIYAGEFSVNLPAKDVTVEHFAGKASFKGGSLFGNPGDPALPVYTVKFLLPDDTDLSTVVASIENFEEATDIVELSGEWELDPIPPYLYGEDRLEYWPDEQHVVDGKNVSKFSSQNYLLTSYIADVKTSIKKKFKLVRVKIYPYNYNPGTKK